MTEINQGLVLYTAAKVLENFLIEDAPERIREATAGDARLSRADRRARCHAVENLLNGFVEELERRINDD